MIEVIVVDLMSTQDIVLNVSAMKILTTVQFHLIWLAMDIAMMNPTMQIVALTVGIAVVHVQLQIIVLIVCVMKDHQQMQTVSKYSNRIYIFPTYKMYILIKYLFRKYICKFIIF
mgnify:CR=1 FL=1